ncbi:DeoR family transcriptional regulator [Morganella morganii]|uniref:DeoR family transcriptional regulator n=1 Tax=Morganella morganii TaxID=582 RepID=UPI00298E5CB1|nr:DeoR family transcriptional regulator [Morganella morganii]MDW7793169.1 DeoR family transcriptional regulator [Morganella morganii]
MKKKNSLAFIRERLIKNNVIYVKELSALLHVSERTIRRYIDELQLSGVAVKFHGGVKLQKIEAGDVIKRTINETRAFNIEDVKKTEKKNTKITVYYIFSGHLIWMWLPKLSGFRLSERQSEQYQPVFIREEREQIRLLLHQK